MPSYLHEGLLLLFRDRPSFAPKLVSSILRIELPRHPAVHVLSADLTDAPPVECRADLVLQLGDNPPVLGIVVEVQLSRDPDKEYVWPTYAINLRTRLKCPVRVLVFTPDESVARWAAKPIDPGYGDTFTPWVIGRTVCQ